MSKIKLTHSNVQQFLDDPKHTVFDIEDKNAFQSLYGESIGLKAALIKGFQALKESKTIYNHYYPNYEYSWVSTPADTGALLRNPCSEILLGWPEDFALMPIPVVNEDKDDWADQLTLEA